MGSATSAILTVFISEIISILGFIVTYVSMGKVLSTNYINKRLIRLDEMSVISYEVLKSIQNIINVDKNEKCLLKLKY